ncbi:MAG: hypothetical protein HC840_28950 [Leptolyngbyaceae cyanobacterium RM2_2_4]|nr:hypothetical protein [Leptolyngbyaceae cyanobacterium RM2_2_4]
MKFHLYKIMHHECLVASTERARRFSENTLAIPHSTEGQKKTQVKKVMLF